MILKRMMFKQTRIIILIRIKSHYKLTHHLMKLPNWLKYLPQFVKLPLSVMKVWKTKHINHFTFPWIQKKKQNIDVNININISNFERQLAFDNFTIQHIIIFPNTKFESKSSVRIQNIYWGGYHFSTKSRVGINNIFSKN